MAVAFFLGSPRNSTMSSWSANISSIGGSHIMANLVL
jgi:hypothetical protein